MIVSLDILHQTIDALSEHNGNKQRTAGALGVPVSTLKDRVRQAARRGITDKALTLRKQSILHDSEGNVLRQWDKLGLEGREPEDSVQLPDPKRITKISTLYDQEGRVSQQWVSERPEDAAREKIWTIFAQELAAPLPRAKPIPAPVSTSDELLACYPVGDHHLGMFSCKEETGDNYNVEIAERLLSGATDYLMHATPKCAQALIVFLGDFMHYDGMVPVTPLSSNPLDADGRFPQMVRASVRSMRYMIERALKRHGNVHVIVEIGNHDLSSSIFLMECLKNIYEDEPRITIDTSPRHYHYYQFGKVLIGTHHGHTAKLESLPLIMATDVPVMWGTSKHRTIWTGHVHHSQKLMQSMQRDFPGVEVESFRVLAPADAWAAQKGYRAIRDMKAIVMHAEYGEMARHTVNPQMLSARRTA